VHQWHPRLGTRNYFDCTQDDVTNPTKLSTYTKNLLKIRKFTIGTQNLLKITEFTIGTQNLLKIHSIYNLHTKCAKNNIIYNLHTTFFGIACEKCQFCLKKTLLGLYFYMQQLLTNSAYFVDRQMLDIFSVNKNIYIHRIGRISTICF
jgi:hypothetical protein